MKVKKNSIIVIVLMILYLLVLLFTPYNLFEDKTQIYILSVYGLIELLLIYYTEHLKTGKYLTLYNIFISFYFLFNYGQCIMWAFGIHTEHEIGKWWTYIYSAASSSQIIRTQLFVLYSAFFLNTGSIIYYFITKRKDDKIKEDKLYYKANIILSIITIPCMFYTVIHNLLISYMYGYSSIYYGEYAYSGNSILIILGGMGFACLIGLLINSNFNRKTVKFVLILFGIYVILDLASGDRGGFLYKLILLFYIYNSYYKKLNIRKLIIYFIFGFISLYFIYAIKEIRNTGISIDAILNSVNFNNNPLIKAIFEMGFSMNILIVLLSKNVVYPYGNTYINGLIGMPTAHVIEYLKPGYIGVSEWFSQKFLNISYGAGFSIIGESYINYGYYGSLIMQVVLGMMICWLINGGTKNMTYNNKLVINITATSLLIPMCRNTFQIFAKNFFYGVMIYYVLILIIHKYLTKKDGKQ